MGEGRGALGILQDFPAASSDAGRVSVVAEEILILKGGIVESLNTGSGVDGGVDLAARGITLRGGSISVDSADARAGDIRLSADDRLRVEGSRIVADSGGDGGDIVLGAGRFLYGTGSVITATAQGNGGNLSIRGPQVVFDGGTIGAGRGGTRRLPGGVLPSFPIIECGGRQGVTSQGNSPTKVGSRPSPPLPAVGSGIQA